MDEFVIDQSVWQRGLTFPALIEGMDVNQTAMRRRYQSVQLTREEI